MKQAKPIRILFLCTGNSCRSQMAEAILRHLAEDHFDAHSAGSRPAGFIHPLAIEALETLQIPVLFAESKSWDRYKGEQFDAVITLCDDAAAEECPNWPGAPLRAHWSMPDPALHLGDERERRQFALSVARRLQAKIEGLIQIDWTGSRKDIQEKLEWLAKI